MEIINNSDVSQEDYSKDKNKYLELKWKLMFHKYKDEQEKEEILKQKLELEKEWGFEENSTD